MAGALTADAESQAACIASNTGLNLNVVRAWLAQESLWGRSPGGLYNFLNLKDPSTGGFADYQTNDEACQAVVNQLGVNAYGYPGILGSAGGPPQTQIAAIAASSWDQAHYGGPGGPNLLRVYNQLVSHSTAPISTSGTITAVSLKGAAALTKEPAGTVDLFGKHIALGQYLLASLGASLMLAGLAVILIGLALRSRAGQQAVSAASDVVPAAAVAKGISRRQTAGAATRAATEPLRRRRRAEAANLAEQRRRERGEERTQILEERRYRVTAAGERARPRGRLIDIDAEDRAARRRRIKELTNG